MSMLLDLSRLRSGVERVDRQFEPDGFDLEGDAFRLAGPVALVLEASKDAKKVRLVGRVLATLECPCSRCLEPFSVPVDAAVDALLLPTSAGEVGAEREIGAEDLAVSYYKDDVVDLGELMREQFYLALPMKPLCQEDCRGLCPTCGVNRNREVCACKTEWVDPRLEALRRFSSE